MNTIYEVVSGRIQLGKKKRFEELHKEILIPIMDEIGIEAVVFLHTEIGEMGRFIDVYRYESMADYERLTDQLIGRSELEPYYSEIGQCIEGNITVELMTTFPYSPQWS